MIVRLNRGSNTQVWLNIEIRADELAVARSEQSLTPDTVGSISLGRFRPLDKALGRQTGASAYLNGMAWPVADRLTRIGKEKR
jgi:hypothetical protein